MFLYVDVAGNAEPAGHQTRIKMETSTALYPVWQCDVEISNQEMFEYRYVQAKPDGQQLSETEVRRLSLSRLENGSVHFDYFLAAGNWWVWRWFTSTWDQLEKKLNDKLSARMKPLERSLNEFAQRWSQQWAARHNRP